jgi:hypothetical protein
MSLLCCAYFINGYWWLFYQRILVAITSYFINGYWWLFYWWLLLAILSMAIGGYFIGGYY